MRLSFLIAWARRFSDKIALITALSLAGSLPTLAVPWLLARLAGSLVGEGTIDLPRTLALLAAALVLASAITIAVAVLSETASGQILAALRKETHQRLMAMSIGFHDRSRNGDLLGLMSYEVENLSAFLSSTLTRLPSMLITAAGAFVILFLIDPLLTLTIPALIPVFFIGMKLLGRRLRVLGRKARKAEVEIVWLASSDLEMLPAIKTFAVEDEQRRRYDAAVEKARMVRLRQTRITAAIQPTIALVAAGAAIAILLLGSDAVQQGTRSPSDLFAFLLYAALLTRPIASLGDAYSAFQITRGTLARLEAVFAKAPEPGYAKTGLIDRAQGAITFEDVSFAYQGRAPVLTHASLTIQPGETIALTGDNGSGKSTLISLLLRFYDPDSGRILIDGQDISEVQVQSLRRQFGYVPQRPLLLDGSVAENIAFGVPDPDPARIEQAARAALAWDFIADLPRGLETRIGDDGVRLSGGQRQRVALARALYHDPAIYIFDEATSMFDVGAEAAFVESCAQLLKGRTVILITHRPASLALADRVIHLGPEGLKDVTGRAGSASLWDRERAS